MLTTTIFLTCQLALATIGLLQAESTDFGDLGKTLLVGFVLAVAAGVAFTLVRLRLRDKKPLAARVISISSPKNRE